MKINQHLIKRSILGMLLCVFLLHILLILISMDKGALTLTMKSELKGSDLFKYVFQFLAACWTGFAIPIGIQLLKDDGKHFHLRVVINMALFFSIYLTWFSFLFGVPNSLFSFLLLFILFAVCEYWMVYGLQYLALKRNVDAVNKQIDSIENGFLRQGGYADAVKKYPL